MAHQIGRDKRFFVRTSSGFWILLSALLSLDRELRILLPALVAAGLHEIGHIIAIYIVGGHVKGIDITLSGAEMRIDEEKHFSYWEDAAVAAAGPAASFLCALLGQKLKFWIFAAMCAGQGIFNLMPVGPLDGGRFLYAIVAGFWGSVSAERVISLISALLMGVLLGAGFALLREYGNPTLAITSGWLLMSTLRRKR